MAKITDARIKDILDRDSIEFHKAPAEASTLDALTMYFRSTSEEMSTKTRQLVDAIGDTYNAAIEEGYIVGFKTALEISGVEITDDQIERYLAGMK